MALEYTLSLETDLEPSKAIALLMAVEAYHSEAGQVVAPGVTVVTQIAKGLSAEVILDEFSFAPILQITFRLDKFGDLEGSRKLVIRAVNTLLRKLPGRAVLLFNGEVVILQRTLEDLLLNDDRSFWREDMLSLIDQPYEWAQIASI